MPEEYIFYNTPYWFWYCKKEAFDWLEVEVTDRVNKLLSEQEADKLTNDSRDKVRLRIMEVLDNK